MLQLHYYWPKNPYFIVQDNSCRKRYLRKKSKLWLLLFKFDLNSGMLVSLWFCVWLILKRGCQWLFHRIVQVAAPFFFRIHWFYLKHSSGDIQFRERKTNSEISPEWRHDNTCFRECIVLSNMDWLFASRLPHGQLFWIGIYFTS